MGRPNIVVGGPPEFRGGPDIWAPEEPLVGSLNTCMMLTFLTLAHARDLTPVGYESEAELEPTRKTMEGVEAQCFVNSVKARVTLTPEFVVAPPPSENVLPVKRTLNRLENDLNRSPESTPVRIGHHIHAKHYETRAVALAKAVTPQNRGCEDEYKRD